MVVLAEGFIPTDIGLVALADDFEGFCAGGDQIDQIQVLGIDVLTVQQPVLGPGQQALPQLAEEDDRFGADVPDLSQLPGIEQLQQCSDAS